MYKLAFVLCALSCFLCSAYPALAKHSSSSHRDSLSEALSPAIDGKNEMEVVGNDLRTFLFGKNIDLSAAKTSYEAAAVKLHATAVCDELRTGHRLPSPKVQQAVDAFNSSVLRFKDYAKSKLTTRSIALAGLVPIALSTLGTLWHSYEAVKEEQRQALIEQIQQELKMKSFEEL